MLPGEYETFVSKNEKYKQALMNKDFEFTSLSKFLLDHKHKVSAI